MEEVGGLSSSTDSTTENRVRLAPLKPSVGAIKGENGE